VSEFDLDTDETLAAPETTGPLPAGIDPLEHAWSRETDVINPVLDYPDTRPGRRMRSTSSSMMVRVSYSRSRGISAWDGALAIWIGR
jgi:hypothetical protein